MAISNVAAAASANSHSGCEVLHDASVRQRLGLARHKEVIDAALVEAGDRCVSDPRPSGPRLAAVKDETRSDLPLFAHFRASAGRSPAWGAQKALIDLRQCRALPDLRLPACTPNKEGDEHG
jgi:hypothetical protein